MRLRAAGARLRRKGPCCTVRAKAAFLLLAVALAVAAGGCAGPSTAEQDAFAQIRAMERTTYPAHRPVEQARPDLPALDEQSALADYLAYAERNNPALEAAFQQWRAALHKVPQARTLPEPQVGFGQFLWDYRGRRSMRRNDRRMSQEFPWFGVLALEADMALQEAYAARERYEAARVKVAYEVKKAWAEYYFVGREIELTRQNVELMKYLEVVARTRYAAGAGGHPDVIKAQVELGKLDNELRTLHDMLEPVVARLNAALARPPKTPIALPRRLAEDVPTPEDTALFEQLRQANPELKALQFMIEKEQRAIQLAHKQYYPRFMVELDYMDMRTVGETGTKEPDEFMAAVTLSLPVWREKYRAAVVEAEAELRAAERMRQDKENMLDSEIKMALYGLRDAARKLRFYRDTLIPKGKESFVATQMAFRTGKVDFLDLVEAQRTLLEFEMERERALSNLAQRFAEIEMLVGAPLAAPQEETSPADPGQMGEDWQE